MNHQEFLQLIKRHRLPLLIIFLVSFIGGGYLIASRVLKYQGNTIFYLANESLVNPAVFGKPGQEDLLQVNLAQERITQLAYSNEMANHLIKQFNLYHHYNVDTTKKFYHNRTVQKLFRRISIKRLSGDISSLTVTDRNNEIAAAMANAIVWKLDQLNKKYLISKLQSNLAFYDSFVRESEKIANQQNRNLQDNISKLSDLRMKSSDGKPLPNVEFSIYEAASQIQDMTLQLLKAKNLYNSTLQSVKSKNLPSVVIIRSAMPELNSKKPFLIGYSMLLGILAMTVYGLIVYFYSSYKNDIKFIFSK